MTRFDACLPVVLKWEGEWSDHPRDPGGATMKGITLATYTAWLGRQPSKAELRAITDDEVRAIYRKKYWDKVRGDDLPAGLDMVAFDAAVNSGPRRGAQWLQQALGVAADGVIGPATIRAAQHADVSAVVRRAIEIRMAFLRGLSTWDAFGRGWTNRVDDVKHAALSMVNHTPAGDTTMTQHNQAILAAAAAYLGEEEWPGAKSNPAIDGMFDDSGHEWGTDDVPWCAAFVNSVLASLGLPHTGKLNARSYENYGTGVSIQNAQPGDIVVFWRGTPSSWQGHVAFLVRFEGRNVIVRGGNQGNKVSDAPYPIDRIVAIRRADGVQQEGPRPVLREGDRGAFVLDLQHQLTELGYTLGKKDGVFGSRTLASVVAFQADSDLTADGIVGPKTWAALAEGEPRIERDVTEDDLAGKSRTYDTAQSGKNVATVGGAVATASVALAEAQNAVSVAQEAEGLVEQIGSLAPSIIAVVAIGVVAYFAYQHFTRIKEIRLDDARTGRNDGV